jgi:hypothetical protein
MMDMVQQDLEHGLAAADPREVPTERRDQLEGGVSGGHGEVRPIER